MNEGQRFTCLRCGICCQFFRQKGLSGLMLFPNETHLFKREDIAPNWGIGKTPQTKNFEVVTYQLIKTICPHYRENACLIHRLA